MKTKIMADFQICINKPLSMYDLLVDTRRQTVKMQSDGGFQKCIYGNFRNIPKKTLVVELFFYNKK